MSASNSTRPVLDLQALLAPKSIAIIGASADEGRHNGRPIANLLRTGYAGRIYPITPREGDVRGIPSYRQIADVPEQVDLAYLLVRADLVPRLVEECARAGVRNLVVNSSGFAEEGEEGARAQERLRALAWEHGMRIIGPNCIGLLSPVDNAVSVTTLNITIEHTPGDVAIISQSGGMATNLFNRAQGDGIGVRAMVSLGNEADVDVADVVEALADDPHTNTILLYVEQLRDVRRFRGAVRRARAAGKVIAGLKVGRTAAGVRSAQSHTGAMAGSYAVFDDLVSAMGVTLVENLDELLDFAYLRQQLGDIEGRRVLVVSPSGGECGYVADLVETAGLEMPEISERLASKLAQTMRFGAPSNPLDLTGQVIGDNTLLGTVFAEIDRSAEFDVVIVALPTWGEFDSARLMPAVISACKSSKIPMLVTAWNSRGLTEYRDELLRDAPIASFENAGRAVSALRALVDRPRAIVYSCQVDERVELAPTALADEAAAKRWLASLGIAVSEEHVVSTGDEPQAPSVFPVVVKGIVPGLAHKSEYGLVKVGVQNQAELQQAVAEIREAAAKHDFDLEGSLIAKSYSGVELIAGVVADPSFGKVLMLGAGGVLAELLDDKVFVACPASDDSIRSALSRLRIHRLLTGYRGEPKDIDALIRMLVRVSEVAAACEDLTELDLNPIIVGEAGEGAVVVDALVRGRAEVPVPVDELSRV